MYITDGNRSYPISTLNGQAKKDSDPKPAQGPSNAPPSTAPATPAEQHVSSSGHASKGNSPFPNQGVEQLLEELLQIEMQILQAIEGGGSGGTAPGGVGLPGGGLPGRIPGVYQPGG
jgi:hypothetical protein